MASIDRRPDGTFRARWRDEAGKQHARHFRRKIDAQALLDEVTASQVTGTYVDPGAGRVTFAAYYADWSTRQVWATTTVKASDLAARSVTFADVPLRDLRRRHLESWVKTMSRGGSGRRVLAPGTVKTRFNNVRAVLRAAVRDRVIPSDPSERVTLPRRRRAEAAMRLPTVEEVRAILAATGPEYHALVALAAFAGLRLGEAAAVQVGDVNFPRRELAVSRQVQRAGGGELGGPPPQVPVGADGVPGGRSGRDPGPPRP